MNGHRPLAPSPWICRFAPLLPPGAHVLDVAAGHGRHARWLAAQGARVHAVDIDADALGTLAGVGGVATQVADLEGGPWPFADATYDAIVVVHYLHRPAFAELLRVLKPDGALLYETFATGNEAFGRPSNPAFLLRENELLDIVRERLFVVAFEQGRVDGDRVAVMQRIAAIGRARGWPPPLPAQAG
ncbi:MAG TPA: class I SAM-dependent methyltransferase [Casimicrobiaceae bacterium]|nr:class I SAM-dependent methyltransferase [Casimicrobiaceae bacterium]